MLPDVAYVDLMKVAKRTEDMTEWVYSMMDMAMTHQTIAEDALTKRKVVTAGDAFLRAAIYNHFAQMNEFMNVPAKLEAVRRTVQNYNEAAPLLDPPSERVEVPFENITLPGFLRLPRKGNPRPPCVLIHGGLDSTKEELHFFQDLCLSRGLATFAFDGPGQGEVTTKMRARYDYDRPVSAIIDYLETRDEIDNDRIGIIGRSAGGYYAPRAAAFEKRLKACVAWGALYEIDWENMPNLHENFSYDCGMNYEEAKDYARLFSLKGVAEKITCPLYVLHGKLDPLIPWEQAARLAKEASGPTELNVEEEGTHVATNIKHIVNPKMADFLAATLLP